MTRSSNVARGSLTTFSRQARATRRHLSLAPAFSHNHNLHVIYTRSYCSTSPQSGTTKPNLTLLYNEALRDIFVESSNLPAIFMIYEDMLEKGIEPNIDTFHILISTCLHTGDPATPLEFFDAIREYEFEYTPETWALRLRCVAARGNPREVAVVLTDLKDKEDKLETVASYLSVDEFSALLQLLSSTKADKDTADFLLSLLAKSNSDTVESTKDLVAKLQSVTLPEPDATPSV